MRAIAPMSAGRPTPTMWSMSVPQIRPLRVVVAGGGVAALETLMALHDLGEGQLDVTLVAPGDEFVLRPMAVAVPFSTGHVTRVPLARVCARFGAVRVRAAVVAVDPAARTVACHEGTRLAYDALVLATGAVPRPAYRAALTFDDADPTRLNGLLRDIEMGLCASLALVVPPGATWSLPIYELALQIARHAHDAGIDAMPIHLVTPEQRPLGIFGPAASDAVGALLERAGITLHAGCYAAIERPGRIVMAPGGRRLEVARIVALPVVSGRAIAGVPSDGHGFFPVDGHGRVRGLAGVYAVGDGADFPVKQGGLATQQADAAARDIAAAAGAAVAATPFRPVLRGKLLTGDGPRFLRHDVAGGGGEGRVSVDALWWPPAKVVGHYLAPWLAREARVAADVRRPDALAVDVRLPDDRDAQPLALEPLGPLPRHGRW